MKVASITRSEVLVAIAALVICPLVATAAAMGGKLGIMAVAGLLAAIVGVYVGLRHPLWLYWGMAVAVGALPFGYVPGVHIPLYLPFAAGALLAAIIHPTAAKRTVPLVKAVAFLVLMSAITVIFTFSSVVNILDYAKWAIATSAMFALLSLPRDQLERFGRIFVYAATFNALIGIASVVMSSNQTILKPFKIFGYAVADTERFFFTGGTTTLPRTGRFDVGAGSQSFTRLGGLWLDPNGAGIGLVIAMVVALLVLSGKQRVVVAGILGAAIALTLSRSAMMSLGAGLALVFIFHPMKKRDRQIMLGTLSLAFAAALIVPSVRTRIFNTLSSNDAGATDRIASIKEFPGRMGGHWLFGWGWSQREFKDGAYAFTENFVSNAPLISIHRAGVIVGGAFITAIVIGCVMGYRLLRSNSFPAALYGGTFIGFSIIALNLDHPVVVIPQIVFLYTIFLTFLVYADDLRRHPPEDPAEPFEAAVPSDHTDGRLATSGRL